MRTKLIKPPYAYAQYKSDDNVSAFFVANGIKFQEQLDWMCGLNLPIYTTKSGDLLDFIAAGLYGFPSRPLLPISNTLISGEINSTPINELEINKLKIKTTGGYIETTDDIFKRIITWHVYKGDGQQFTINWLKRRIFRFLFGENGENPEIDNTYRISLSFGDNKQVNIRIINNEKRLSSTDTINENIINGYPINSISVATKPIIPLAKNAAILQVAINSGVLELPFQYTYFVTIY
jgi:hypothetical protein